MARISERDRFIAVLVEEATGATPAQVIEAASSLMRLGASYKRVLVNACNYPQTDRENAREKRLEANITEIAQGIGLGVVLGGDPRGCVVKIVLPSGRTNDFGDDGWNVPNA